MDAFLPDGGVLIYSLPPKVGDTLSAIVLPDDATVTYKWTINGQNPASGETFTVPATAKYGDEITVVVTDEDGNTATDTVYVGGLTILSVEPTTAADGEIGYKYIRVTFSKSLDSLDSSEVEIRHAKSNRLFSIESVKLSSDGTFADVVLYGSNDADGTTFLQANQPYICTLSKDGETASLGFEIPGFVSDAYVKSVDVEKRTIKIGNSQRTNQNYAGNVNSSYNLPSSFNGNLGTLVGNTVSFYYDADLNISDFEVQDQEVVIGAFKYNVPSGSSGYDDNYFSQGDDKYYLRNTSTASSNWTHVYTIYDGTAFEPVKDTVYQYAKLVLNPDGTVAQAALLPAWTGMIFATSIDEDLVTESKSKSKDFDGYTIVKDDAYITTDDLEEGDVIYYYSDEDAGVKFAEVYNNEVSGELTKTYSKTAILDGTSYTYVWTDAYAGRTKGQYVKDGKYVDLEEKVLLAYEDEEEVTFTLNRLGNVVKAEGTTGEEVSNTTEYMLTANATGYKAAGTNYISFKVSDGSSKSTIVVPIDDLKKIDGVTLAKLETAADPDAGLNNKVYLANVADQDDTATLTANWDDNADGDDDNQDDADIEHFINAKALSVVFPAGTLLKVTTNEDGDVIGIATSVSQNIIDLDGNGDPADIAAADTIAQLAGTKDQVFKPGMDTVITTAGKKLSISDDAEVWIANADYSTVKKVAYGDYTGTSLKNQNANVLIVPSGTTVKQVVILDSKNTLGDAEVASKEWGVVTESLVGIVDADHTNNLKKLTVLDPSGEKVVYDNIKNTMVGQDVGSIVFLELDSEGQVIRINNAADMLNDNVAIAAESTLDKDETDLSNGDEGFDNNSMLKDDTNRKWIVEAADGAVVAKFDGTKVTKTTISAINNEESMEKYTKFIYNSVRSNGDDIEASVIVALKGAAAPVVPVWSGMTFTSDAGNVVVQDTDTGDAIASTAATTLTVTPVLDDGVAVASYKWYYKATATATAEPVEDDGSTANDAGETKKTLKLDKVTNGAGQAAGTVYYVVITGDDGNAYTSPEVTLVAPAFSAANSTATAALTANDSPLVVTVTLKDQFGVNMTVDPTTMAGGAFVATPDADNAAANDLTFGALTGTDTDAHTDTLSIALTGDKAAAGSKYSLAFTSAGGTTVDYTVNLTVATAVDLQTGGTFTATVE